MEQLCLSTDTITIYFTITFAIGLILGWLVTK